MGALPEGYTPPKSGGNYMKLGQGANKFRILSKIIVGWETWLEEDGKRKPVRSKRKDELPPSENRPKFFWAMVVWNYNESQLQVLEVTQVSIRKALEELEANEDWGDLRTYDINVKREGEGMETVYSVIPTPKKTLDEAIKEEFLKATINLEALFSGDNPFEEASMSDEELENVVEDMDQPEKKKKGSAGDVIIDPQDLPF